MGKSPKESLQQALADGAAMVEAERLQEQSSHEGPVARSQSRGRRPPSPGLGPQGVPQPQRRSWSLGSGWPRLMLKSYDML